MKNLFLVMLAFLFIASCGERGAVDQFDEMEREEEVPVDDTYRPIPTEIP